jgi:microcystin-dependent protein
MSEPFLSEIKVVSFNFPPKGWALCNGQLLPINQNQALFALLGTTYGGNGQTNFALPDLRGRVPIHMGSGYTLGQNGGQEAHTINQSEMPLHTHSISATTNVATQQSPGSSSRLARGTSAMYAPAQGQGLVVMSSQAVSSIGGSQPHQNMMPLLTLNFIIALQGIFPSQN